MSQNQYILNLEPGLTERYGSLLEVVAAGAYHRGLKRVAMDLDKAPGNLSRELAGDSDRHLSVESLERYMQSTKDFTPIHYLIARYLGDASHAEAAALQRVEALLSEVASITAQFGGKANKARR